MKVTNGLSIGGTAPSTPAPASTPADVPDASPGQSGWGPPAADPQAIARSVATGFQTSGPGKALSSAVIHLGDGLAGLTPGAPLLPSTDASQVLPAAIQTMPAMDRHLWYFKAASEAAGTNTPLQNVQVNTQDHYLGLEDVKNGLQQLGVQGGVLDLVSMGVLVDRGARQLLQKQGSPGQMDIGPDAAWSTAHPDSARSGVYDASGNVDPQKQQQFLDLLDPQGTGKITTDQFKVAGKALVEQRDTGTGLGASFKRFNDEGTFDRAWNSFMLVAGHDDPSTGKKYVTPDDVKWFFDGSYFFRRAEANQVAGS